MTTTTLTVLACFLEARPRKLAGSDIINATKMFSGTLYPILDRLEKAGYLTGSWEEPAPEELGRPRRKHYELTAFGEKLAISKLRELTSAVASANAGRPIDGYT